MLLFVSIWNREDTKAKKKKNNKGKTEQDKKNEDEIYLFERVYLSQHPHGNPFLEDSAQVRKWHASQVWINSKPFLHAAADCS